MTPRPICSVFPQRMIGMGVEVAIPMNIKLLIGLGEDGEGKFRRNVTWGISDLEDPFRDLDMEKWCTVMPNLKSITLDGNLPQPQQWLNSEGEFALKHLTRLCEIVFKDSRQEFGGRPLVLYAGEVISKAWTVVVDSSPRKDMVIWGCRSFDALHLRYLQRLGLNVIWK